MKKRLTFLLLLLLAIPVLASISSVQRHPTTEVQGAGLYPYNYRVIDNIIHAGGHPLNPATKFGNSDEQALYILNYLKSQGVLTVIDLENTGKIQHRYQKLLDQVGIKRLHVPMNSMMVPNKREWLAIKQAMTQPVYIHCKWGADRTGAIIGRYLVELKGYYPDDAYKAVISGGSHSGYLGGLKQGIPYIRLKRFILTPK